MTQRRLGEPMEESGERHWKEMRRKYVTAGMCRWPAKTMPSPSPAWTRRHVQQYWVRGLCFVANDRSRIRRIGYPGPLVLCFVWLVIGALSYGRHYLMDSSSRTSASIFEFLMWQTCFLPWAGLSPLTFRLERKYPIDSERRAAHLAILAVTGVLFSYLADLSSLGISILVRFLFRAPIHISPTWWKTSVWDLSIMMMMFGSSVIAGYVIRNFIRLHEREQEAAELALQKAELESSLRQAQLETLRTRLNPHFLFNCLQNISVLIHEDPRTAKQMLTRLGDLLRTALRGDSNPETTLKSEIGLTKSYVAVEQVRFGDRLSVLFDITPESQAALVPTFILQPLVENAIVHGLRDAQRGGVVSIRSAIDAGSIVLTVTDNGIGFSASDTRNGVGLSSTCERLERMYPGQHQFSIRRLPEGGTEVFISLPFRVASESADVTSHEQTSFVDR